ncbi:MAG: adenylate/guanylate cyclase domain-containing protein [Acidobacteriota bacterium]
MAKLKIINSDGQSFEFPITKDEVKIGRSPSKNDLVLPSKQVSIAHASIKRINDRFLLTDLKSTNGTYVNNERIAEHWLRDGEYFAIANFTLQLLTISNEPGVTYYETPLSDRAVVRSTSVFTNLLDAFGDQQEQINKRAELEAKLEEKIKALEMLYAFGKTLSSVFDIDKIFSQIVDLLFKVTPAERCAILLWDEAKDLLEPRLISFRPESGHLLASYTLNISRTITNTVISQRIALLSEDLQGDYRFNTADSIVCQSIHSVMCVPMIGKQRVLGVIYVDKLGITDPFNRDDLDLLNAVAAQAAIAVDNAFAYDQLARDAVQRASYQRFLPNNVVDLILNSPQQLKLGGVTQPVTILFADIRDFMAMVGASEPEVVIYMLNRFFSAMIDIIFAHGGTLDKFLGDGLMALFGAPYQSFEDPKNAVTAAIAMQRRLVTLNNDLRRYGFQSIEIGIGINCGDVTVGYIGSEMRMDYTAIGNTVNLAARLTKQAGGQQILITDQVRMVIGDNFQTRLIQGINLKGLVNIPDIYEVIYN